MKKSTLLVCAFMMAASSLAAAYPRKPIPFKALRPMECKLVQKKRHTPENPHMKNDDDTSANWSGYAAVTSLQKPAVSSVTRVAATWTVPTVKPSASTTYCSIWVGIDGFKSGSVEQIGTEHDWNDGKEEHYAWFEMYPKYPHQLSGFPVEPGDVISAEVSYQGNDAYKMTINNHTKSVTTTVPVSHTTGSGFKRSSAEWIVEAPASQDGILPLANFQEVTLTDCSATINGVNGSINDGRWAVERLQMTSNGGTKKAETSQLANGGKAFSVTWEHK